MDINPFDPAFKTEHDEETKGLSKLEYFAAAALQGILANPNSSVFTMTERDAAEYARKHAVALVVELRKVGA